MLIGQGQEVLSSGATKNLLMVAAIATVLSTDRPFEVGPNSVAFLLRFPLPQMGMPYIFGKFRAQTKCPISNIFEQMNF